MLPKSLYKHLLPALLAGLALRLFFIWHFPFHSGDTAYYEELARNWLYHGVYGFYSHGQLLPSDARVPGYPAFLAGIYFLAGTSRKAVMLAQAFVDLATCVLAAGIADRLAAGAPGETRSRVAAAALWLTALCPFTANYTAVPQTEVLATFFTTLALLIFLSPAGAALDLMASNRGLLRAVKNWFLGGLVVGLGTLVRPETPLLLGAVPIALWLRYRRPANWRKLAVATLCTIVGLLLPLAPWAARNAVNLGRVQFLAPRYAETFGDVLLDVSFSGRVSFHLETALAGDRIKKSSFLRSGFSRRIVAGRFPAGSLQSNARNDARARSRIRRVGAGTHTASSHPQLGLDSDRARCRYLVHSADCPAALLRKTLAAERKLSRQSHRLQSYSRLRAAQCSICCYGSCSRLVFAHEPRSLADRGVHPHSHGIPHTTANLRTALRLGLLPRAAGPGRATFPRSANQLETIPAVAP